MTGWSETIPRRQYREPYLPQFFAEAASAMELTRTSRLLDLACGTGEVAFGFAPYVGSLAGVEREQPMVDAARAAAARLNIDIRLVCAEIEGIPDDIGRIDVATIGRAHWYLPRAATLAQLDRFLTPTGRVLICGATTFDRLSGAWAQAYHKKRDEWRRVPRPRISELQFMAGSPFAYARAVQCYATIPVSVEDLVQRALAHAGTSPEALGADKERYVAEIRATLEPHAVAGMLQETIVTYGSIFARLSAASN